MDPLLNTILRHQIYLEGLKEGKSKDFFKVMGELSVALRQDLSSVTYDNLGDMSKRQLNVLLAKLKKTAKTIFDAYLNDIIKWLQDYMHEDYELFKAAFVPVAQAEDEEAEDEIEEENDVWAAILLLPMGANGIVWRTFLSAVGILGTNKITQLVTQHWVNNSKKQELLDALLGTKSAKLNDGLIAKLTRQGQDASATVIQHIAANTSAAVAKTLFGRYQWISVLDSGTTDICRSRAWLIYRYGEGPIPPAHVRCRSSTIPVTKKGPLSDMPSFQVWANAQSEEFRADAFDGKVSARYEGSKALTLEEYKGKRSFILS